ncbi:cytokine receptor common subunit beta-like [Engraulis encrasicolus]|uniref:cytokine receptor common subunit beta-like n=1 Tax=Engraulis encrasicolus TaxID=184585 RepID=UPI002FCECB70
MMHLTWATCVLLLPLVTCTHHTNTTPYDSLQCYNNYVSSRALITCSWIEEEGPRNHTHTPLVLRHEHGSRVPCVITTSSSAHERGETGESERSETSERAVQCVINATAIGGGFYLPLTIGGEYTFYFDHAAAPNTLSANLAQHVHVLSPEKLAVEALPKVKGYRLSWASPYPHSSNLTSDLHYQVTYGTAGHDWTTLDTSHTFRELRAGSLLPGRRYEARVRARSSQWQWSQWSPPVAWNTEEEVGAYGFWCVLGADSRVTCHWRLRSEHAQILEYRLNCHHLHNDTAVDCCCSPQVCGSEGSGEELEFCCQLCVSDLHLLHVELKHMYKDKTFYAPGHIQPETPPGFKVKYVEHLENKGAWRLSWGPPDIHSNVPLQYELRYRPQEAEEWKTFFLDRSTRSHTLPGNLLDSTVYEAEIRAMVGPSSTYSGLPSPWSAPISWTTQSGPFSVAAVLYTAVTLGVFIGFIFLVRAVPKFQRKIRDWNLSIPSPTHSKVLHEAIKRKASDWLLVVSEKEMSTCVIQEPELTSTSGRKESVWSCSSEESLQLQTYTTGGGCQKEKQLDCSAFSFNGPYISCRKDHAHSCTHAPSTESDTDTDNTSSSSFSSPSSPNTSESPDLSADHASHSSSSSSPSASSSVVVSPVSDVSFLSSLSEVRGGYVATLQMPVEGGAAPSEHPQDCTPLPAATPPSSLSQPPSSPPPPAYSLKLPALHTVVLPHPPGYCSLPSLDLEGWARSPSASPGAPVQSSTTTTTTMHFLKEPPGGHKEKEAPRQEHEGDSSSSYVRLKSPPNTFEYCTGVPQTTLTKQDSIPVPS